jgi:hypothetical protein
MERKTGHNSTFAIGGVSCTRDSFVVRESLYLRINICGENPAHRKSAKRYMQVVSRHVTNIQTDKSEKQINNKTVQ